MLFASPVQEPRGPVTGLASSAGPAERGPLRERVPDGASPMGELRQEEDVLLLWVDGFWTNDRDARGAGAWVEFDRDRLGHASGPVL